MLRFVARRLVLAVPVLLGIVLVVMLTISLIPGDPVALMLGTEASPELVATLRKQLGLDRPFLVRYGDYVWNLLQGDLGRSIRERSPVAHEVGAVWPNTLLLTAAALCLSVSLGVSAGVVSAVRPYSWVDNLVRVFALLGLSMPVFWTGLVMVYIFAFYLRLMPVGGIGTWKHLILPAITLAAPSIALISRMTRSSMLEVMGEDYIRTARAKGLSERVVVFRHALKNAFIPVITLLGIQVGHLLGGAVLTETVFAWPGLGRLMVRAIFARDFPLLQGGVLVMASAFVVINLLVDLSYAWLDPRIHYS